MKKYKVWVKFIESNYTTVEAINEKEALKKAVNCKISPRSTFVSEPQHSYREAYKVELERKE